MIDDPATRTNFSDAIGGAGSVLLRGASERAAYDWPSKRIRRCKVVHWHGDFWKPSYPDSYLGGRWTFGQGYYFRRLRYEPHPLWPHLQWVIEGAVADLQEWPEGAKTVRTVQEVTPEDALAFSELGLV